MLAIKLKMVGRKNQRTFRVIVQEARAKLGGKFVEDLGWYNPHTNQFKLNKTRVEYWVDNGAQPTDTAGRLIKKLKSSEVETYKTRDSRKGKKGPKKEEGAAETSAPAVEGASPAEAPTEAPVIEAPVVEAPAEEKAEEAPAEEAPLEEKAEESKEETTPSDGAPDVSEEVVEEGGETK